MIEGTKTLQEKKDGIESFTVLFWSDWLTIGDTVLPVGQISTDILNLDMQLISTFREKINFFIGLFQNNLMNQDIKKDITVISSIQEKLNEVWDIILSLPLYRYLDLDKDRLYTMLVVAYNKFPDEFNKMILHGTPENELFKSLLLMMTLINDEIISFRTYITTMLDSYFELLKKRNCEYYAYGIYRFFSDSELQKSLALTLPPIPSFRFQQSRHAMIEYTVMPNPEKKEEYVIAERLGFDSIASFLHVDFFRGLMEGNAPRRCHNCGKFFLLTKGYNTCYCNNIAPNEMVRTCRKIGAHSKEAKKGEKLPGQIEYNRVYNRLKTRRSRGKISDDEWNRLVAYALNLKEKHENGEITEMELKRAYEGI